MRSRGFAIAVATVVLAAGCGGEGGSPLPSEGSGYGGVIAAVGVEGPFQSPPVYGVLVKPPDDSDCGITVAPTDDVVVFDRGAYTKADWSDLQPGMAVEVWIDGPVLLSCPGLASARAVEIVG